MENEVRAVSTGVIVALALFVADVLLVETGRVEAFDLAVLEWFRSTADINDAWGPPWFEEAAGEITALGSYSVILLFSLIAAGVLAIYRHTLAIVFIGVAISGGAIVSSVLKLLFERARPDVVEHMDTTFTYSFPSGHALISAMTYLTLAAVAIRFINNTLARRYLLGCAVLLTALVGTSRVYLGVHWPSDVFAGWCLGGAWAGASWLIAHYLSLRVSKGGMGADLGESDV
ncbi:phosphatase PAP2 family protein [Roseibium sp. CAU 1637]|uniref:Phosphatase PAP2 family protein n=1 Tax=Roseibium limicola TaxID=2816037 RepID=A0A939EQ87_9HYPH|nr:phosphatase PAP2 family protein [Roseibium limicola]MBO0346945.1 phosphatase PAP2 family protein [Roseibium limicola]